MVTGSGRTPQLSRGSSRRLVAVALAAFVVAAVGAGPGAAGASDGPQAVAAKKAPAKPGKYKGKVGTFARISFRVRGGKLRGLNAGANGLCQRVSDGFLTRFQLLAINAGKQKLKINRRGRFSGQGQSADGVAWEISGKFPRKGVAKGRFEASAFYFLFPFDGELCSGGERFVARLK